MSLKKGHFFFELIIQGCLHSQRMISVRNFRLVIIDSFEVQGPMVRLALWFWSWTDFRARNNLVAVQICFFAQREEMVYTDVLTFYAYVLCMYHFFPFDLQHFPIRCCICMGYLALLVLTAKLTLLADFSDYSSLFSYVPVLSSKSSTLFLAHQASPHYQLLYYDS